MAPLYPYPTAPLIPPVSEALTCSRPVRSSSRCVWGASVTPPGATHSAPKNSTALGQQPLSKRGQLVPAPGF
jgi:hypothetical protein